MQGSPWLVLYCCEPSDEGGVPSMSKHDHHSAHIKALTDLETGAE